MFKKLFSKHNNHWSDYSLNFAFQIHKDEYLYHLQKILKTVYKLKKLENIFGCNFVKFNRIIFIFPYTV